MEFLKFANCGLFSRIKIAQKVGAIAEQKIGALSSLWAELFEEEIGKEHMRKLENHVEAFFTDIITETEDRKHAIVERIKSECCCCLMMY
jgi:chemotaxis regulatin CheY-phosphate phosphatase CheZ